MSGPVALLKLLGAGGARAAAARLAHERGREAALANAERVAQLDELIELLERNREGAETVARMVRVHENVSAAWEGTDEAVAAWGRLFDGFVAESEEASVAGYSLGSPEILAGVTAEVVAHLEELGVVGGAPSLLDVGCGIGRMAVALSPLVGRYAGIDVSPRMLDAARRRSAGLPNVRLALTSGLDFGAFAGASFDVVLAVDSFPYIHYAGPGLVERHFAEARRVLRAGGSFVLLNFSYTGDLPDDRREVGALAKRHGFHVAVNGSTPFRSWDGALFRLLSHS